MRRGPGGYHTAGPGGYRPRATSTPSADCARASRAGAGASGGAAEPDPRHAAARRPGGVRGVPVAYQLLRRDAAANRATIETLLALGASRMQLVTGATVRGAGIGLLAGSVGTTAAALASPLSPVGMARNAEPDPGLWVDWTALAIVLPLFVFAMAAVGATAMWSAMRAAPEVSGARASRGLGARVPLAVGMRIGRGGRGASAGIGANVVVALLLVGMVVAAGSLEAVPRDAQLSGGVWDAWFDTPPHAADDVDEMLDSLPAVRAHGVGGWFELQSARTGRRRLGRVGPQ